MVISSCGIWDKGYSISDNELKLIKRCERDTQLDKEFLESRIEGRKPCTSPDKYRPMTKDELQKLRELLSNER